MMFAMHAFLAVLLGLHHPKVAQGAPERRSAMGHGCVMGTEMMFVAGSGHGEGCHHSCHRGCRRPVDLRGVVWVNGHGEGCDQSHHRGRRRPVDLRGLVGAPDGWGPKEGGNATSPLHSWGSPTKGTKSEVKTYAGGHHDAPRNKARIQRLSRFPQ